MEDNKQEEEVLSMGDVARRYNEQGKIERAAQAVKKKYRDTLMYFMKSMSVEPGVETELEAGVTVSFSRPERSGKIIEEKLLAKGVAKELIEECKEYGEVSERINVKVKEPKAAPQANSQP